MTLAISSGEPARVSTTVCSAAVPVFKDFMEVALKDKPATPFRVPPGIRLVRVDYMTGQLPTGDATQTILEAFRPDTEPTRDVGSSPFVFGGTAPIDPRVLSGITGVVTSEQQGALRRPEDEEEDELGGLY